MVTLVYQRVTRTTITGWWFGTWNLFFHLLGIMIPTDELHIFQRGGSTTNQFIIHPDVQIKKKTKKQNLRVFWMFWLTCKTASWVVFGLNLLQIFRDSRMLPVDAAPFLEDVEPFHFWGPTPHLQTFAGRFLMFIFYGHPFFSCELVSTVVWSLPGRRRIQATDQRCGMFREALAWPFHTGSLCGTGIGEMFGMWTLEVSGFGDVWSHSHISHARFLWKTSVLVVEDVVK